LAVAAGALLAGYVAPVGPACHGCTSSAASRHAVPLLLDGAETSRRRSRRQLLSSGVGVAATCWALGGMPAPISASYALYQASYETYTERKATGYVPVATDDSATLQQIQEDILKKRPQSERKAKKPPQYCAGQTSSVSPFLENVCGNIGVSKADQSNTISDNYGNMNIGSYGELSGADKMRAEARQAAIREAAENARLRAQVARDRN